MRGVVITLLVAAGACLAPPAWAQEEPAAPASVDVSLYARQGVAGLWNSGPNSAWARETEVRLMADIRAKKWLQVEAHNETFYQGGSARLASTGVDALVNDRGRLLDLSWVVTDGAEHLLVNRFDRLAVATVIGRGRLKVGRQVVTWGNGLLFNPLDLFSPYAPTEIDRDYKRGEDGVTWSLAAGERVGNLEVVALGKRDLTTGKTGMRQSSLGVRHHRLMGDGQWETTAIVGRHFGEILVGGGVVGRIKDVVARSEWVHTRLSGGGGAWTGIANADLAWVWKGMNAHAGAEYYFNSLGGQDESTPDQTRLRALRERLQRGELFARGRHYLDSVINVEPHPLVGVALNTILSVSDASGVLQPSLNWDVSSRIQGRVTATLMFGKQSSDRLPNRIDVRVTTTF